MIRNPRIVRFSTSRIDWQRKFDAALAGLRENVRPIPGAAEPLLIEGGKYQGMWLESGPIDARAYALFDPAPYLAAHRVLFDLQRDDGQIPCFIRGSGVGWSQVQTVTSIAVTALDCALHHGDDAFLSLAYDACARWDAWLVQHRDRRGLGLCEAFCEYDTGHDNSPRWRGLPKVCHDRDARFCPPDDRLPYLAPDLSASLYGGRLALAEMARRLGRPDEAEAWLAKAAQTRSAIFEHLFDEASTCFYDRDGRGRFVPIIGDVLLRVLAEGVVDRELFETIYRRWVRNPEAFWTPFPLPSIAACDPAFPTAIPDNSWGGASQSLTALRAPSWLERYGKFVDLTDLMARWVRGLIASDGFRQQADPFTGVFATTESYSPAMAVMVDHTLRLLGIHVFERGLLSWGCWHEDESDESTCEFACDQGDARLVTRGGGSELFWGGRRIARVRGRARVITDTAGNVRGFVGITSQPAEVVLELSSGRRECRVLAPDEVVDLGAEAEPHEAARMGG